jgi:hypothetical protein
MYMRGFEPKKFEIRLTSFTDFCFQFYNSTKQKTTGFEAKIFPRSHATNKSKIWLPGPESLSDSEPISINYEYTPKKR